MAGLKQARGMAALLGGAAPQAGPSPRLRRRILASVGYEQKKFGWAPALAALAALSLVAAIYFSGREREFAQETEHLRSELSRQTVELTHLTEAFAILNAPDTREVSFGEDQPKPKGKVFVNPSQGVLLIASNLPPAPSGKLYEMWIIKGGKPARAGMFQPDADGSAIHVQRGAVDLAANDAVAVTLENEAGVDAPTSTPLIVAPMVRRAI